MIRFTYIILSLLVIASALFPAKLYAQYKGGSGVGYSNSRYLGNLGGTSLGGRLSRRQWNRICSKFPLW